MKELIIIALLIALIYYYRQAQKPLTFTETDKIVSEGKEFAENLSKNIKAVSTFLKEQLNSESLEEAKEKLGSKTLDEILEENGDWETEVDTLTRTKNSLEADLLAQSNAFQNRLREKDREVKKLKEDLKDLEQVREKLTSERSQHTVLKQQHKGSLERIKLLTGQIQNLEQEIKDSAEQKRKSEVKVKNMPGESPETDKVGLVKEHQEQLRAINLLFDANAKDYAEIDFNGLYELLKRVGGRIKKLDQLKASRK